MATTQAHPEDHIGGPSTKELAGTRLLYTYTTGVQYELTFDSDTVSFRRQDTPPPPPGPDAPPQPGPIPYRARKIREDLYLVHWLVRRDIVVHVTLLIDFKERHVHVSAYMPGGWEFFDMANFEKVERLK